MQQGHEFFAGDGFLFQQEVSQNIQLVAVFAQDLASLLVSFLNNAQHLGVNAAGGFLATGQGRVAAEVLVIYYLGRHHVELFRHAEAGDHATSDASSLLDIVSRAAGDAAEDELFGAAAASDGDNFVKNLNSIKIKIVKKSRNSDVIQYL